MVDPIAAAGQHLPALKREGAAVIVAVTHLAFATDRALVERFPEIDLVIGGHEHFLITATENRTLISKAGSDAKAVARIDVNRQPPGRSSASTSCCRWEAPCQAARSRQRSVQPSHLR